MAYPSDLVRTKNWGTEQLTDVDLEGQLDLIIAWVMASLDSAAGHAHTGVANKSPKIAGSDLGVGVIPGVNLSNAYPVGSIYMNASVATNPATLLGFGTWAAFGAGKVLVGLNGADADFDTVEETGGAKTHTLTAAEMPAHVHTGGVGATSAEFSGGSHPTAPYISTAATGSTGGGGAHNNLQPYIVVYMWKRTA